MNASPATRHHCQPSPAPAHHHRLRHHPRLLPHFFTVATQSALRHLLRLCLLLLSFPSLYLLPSPFPSSPGAAASRSLIVDFLFALAFSSVLLLLALSLNAFPVPFLHLLLPRHQPPSPVLWSIGSSTNKPKADRRPTSGLGVQVYSNGDIYEGEFHQGKCSGSGVYYYYMSGRYDGDWVDGKYNGYGMKTWAQGSRYRGQYCRGLHHGFGVYRFYTGDVYDEEWSNGQSHGCGVHTCEDGSRYVEEFKWGVKHGLGHYHFR